MRTRVTAILIARDGGEWLDQTLAGIAAQTRRPDRLIGVVNGGRERTSKQFSIEGSVSRIVSTSKVIPFGEAVQQGIAAIPSGNLPGDVLPDVESDDRGQPQEWYWLLTEDSAPEPEALAQILATVQRAPSVAIAGPKLVSWDHPDHIIELGQSLTHSGERWLLRRQERDQQQYDHLQDVLGVGPVGMLVRADLWSELSGFDPAYRVYDDGLDLSVRARLAGYRVVVSPTSRVRFAQHGVGGPRIERSRRVLRTAHREARTSQLHRRISYAPAFVAFFMWLGLPLLAIARMAWALIREQPGNMWGEFSSALRVFFRPGALIASRRRVKSANKAGWTTVRPLRTDPKSVRTARMIDREAILAAQGLQRSELHFISTGGLAVLIASAIGAVALTWWAITQTSLTGGALAPLSSFGELWANTRTAYGVPADPFAWVLAVLGTLTFWNPSFSVVLFIVAAVPLAALGGWIWAARLTELASGRALLAICWAFSPVLLGSMAAGRLPTLILAVVLPWLLLAASRSRESWSWAGLTSLLTAVALACAPVLLPAAVVLLVVGLASAGRGASRVLSIAIAPLVLFAPKLLALLRGADPLEMMLDPGISPAFRPGNTWHLLLGFPEFGLEGWANIFDGLGEGLGAAPATVLVGVLLLPIVLLAAVGLISGRVRLTVMHSVLGGLGLLTTVGASRLQLASVGDQTVTLWTGSGLTLYWIALLGLAAMGTTVLRKAASPIVAVAIVAALLAVSPLGVRLATSNTPIMPGETQMPAIVQAAGAQDPALRTLMLDAVGDSGVRAQVIVGAGVRLDDVRTAAQSSSLTEQDQGIAELVAALASSGDSSRAQSALISQGIGFVMLGTNGNSAERSQLQAALDQHAVLENAGNTDHGLLWRVTGAQSIETSESGHASWLDNTSGNLLWWVQLLVLLGMLLLALPTGEVVERPERRRKSKERVAVSVVPVAESAQQDPASARDASPAPVAADGSPDEVQSDAAPEPASAPPLPNLPKGIPTFLQPAESQPGVKPGEASDETSEGGQR